MERPFQNALSILFLIIFFSGSVQAAVYTSNNCGTADNYTVTELLKDTSFANGIQYWDGPYPMTQTCQSNWRSHVPTLKDPPENTPWHFIEVGEKMLLCNQGINPSNGITISYINPTDRGALAGSKKIIDYKNTAGGVNMIFNSVQEWRGGCSLTKNDELNGNAQPIYAAYNGAWDWQHLLLDQKINDHGGLNNRLMVNKYNKLIFSVTLKVNNSTKAASPYYVNGKCPEWDWENHALFYIGFVLDDATKPGDLSKRMYIIFPAWQTYDGDNYFKSGPWIGGDPANAKVYFTGMVGPGAKYEPLSLGNERTYSIDLQELAEEAVGAYNQKRDKTASSWDTNDYYVNEIYLGWEIWGGYDTNVVIKNPSLSAYAYTNHLCSPLYEYWNPSVTDHYYTTDYIPKGFLGYTYEGPAAVIPTINMPGTAKLWRYFNTQAGDHYYSTNIQPFGLGGGWTLERQAGSIFISSPGDGYEPFEEWWCVSNTDHLYKLEPVNDPTSCYTGPNKIGWLKKPCLPNQVSGCKVCNSQGTAWIDTDSWCSANQKCSNGTCVTACVNECLDNGEKQCSGNNVRTCTDINGDGCLEWSGVEPCSRGQTCQNGTCVANQTENSDFPETCKVNQACTITIRNCSNGILLLRNQQGLPINYTRMIMSGDFPITFFSLSPYIRPFLPTATGIAGVLEICFDGTPRVERLEISIRN